MYRQMSDDMDIDAGTIVSSGDSVADVGERIYQALLETASGAETLSEGHMHTLVLGAGFSGKKIALAARSLGTVCGTRRDAKGLQELNDLDVAACLVNDTEHSELSAQLKQVTHLVVSVPPHREPPFADPMLTLLESKGLSALPCLQWIGYLSTIGVYGNADGRFVNEQTPCLSEQSRSLMRIEAEKRWQDFGRRTAVPVSTLRLSGIYGPGRNAVEDAVRGRARMLIKSHQVFNRIHVDDLSRAVTLAAQQKYHGVLNITDDVPAPPQDVIRFAHSVIGKEPPSAQAFETAEIRSRPRLSGYKAVHLVSGC